MQFGVAGADAVDSVAIIVCDDEQRSLLLLCLLSFVSTKINNARTKLVLMCVLLTHTDVCARKNSKQNAGLKEQQWNKQPEKDSTAASGHQREDKHQQQRQQDKLQVEDATSSPHLNTLAVGHLSNVWGVASDTP